MELTISHSSLRLPSLISQRYKAFSNDHRFVPIKPATTDIKPYNNFPKNTNKLMMPVSLCGQSRFSKPLLFGPHKRNFFRVRAEVESVGYDPVLVKAQRESADSRSIFAKLSHIGSTCYKFVSPYAIRQITVSSIILFARVLMENKQLFNWSLWLKAFPGLISMVLAHAYYNGVNQVFDVDIDRVNKPYLPIPAGDLTLKQAWFFMAFLVLAGLLIVRLMNADLITTSIYCFGLLLATCYSAPPFRFKASSVKTIIAIPLMSVVNGIGVLYASTASLGLPFRWSPQIVLITTFTALFFTVICLIKDIPDVKGDMEHNIRTFAAILGPKNTAFLGTGILLVNYVGAIAAAIYMPQAFNRNVVLPANSIFAYLLLFQVNKLDKANYAREASADFFQFLWKLLLLEFISFPFI